jgi:TPR repeat protein
MKVDVESGSAVGRWPGWLVFAVQLVLIGAVSAAPEDDYQRGLKAYQQGDVVAAMSLLRAPANAGHAASQSLLAFILDRADFTEEAARLYRGAAAQGDPEAHAALANLYLTGRGIAKDEKLALQHFSKAAELGNSLAIQVMADAYLKGQMGLGAAPRDNAAAVAAFKRAADLGHLPAAEALARAYAEGSFGLTTDTAQAATWQARVVELRKQSAAAAPAKAKR